MSYTTINPNPLRHVRESAEREDIAVETPKATEKSAVVKNSSRRSLNWMWAAIAFLGGAVAGLYWFGYQNLDILTTHAPQLVPTVQAVGDTLTGRVDRLEQKVRDWDSQNVGNRLTSLEKSADKQVAANAQQAKKAAEAVATRLRADVRAENAGAKAEIAQLKSQLQADQIKLASVQAELARVQKDVAGQRALLDAAEYNRAADRQALLSNAAQLQQGINHRKEELARLEQNLQMDRIDFEANKGQSTKITDGVQLNVSGIDVARRQVDGWVFVMPDRKTVWIRNLNALQPMSFYSDGDSKRRELVITRVTGDAAIGYLLEQKQKNVAQSQSAAPADVAASGL